VTRFAAGVYTPSLSPDKPPKKNGLVEAKGFKKEDFEGEEDTPKKVSADACKWCFWDPCIVDDHKVIEEGRVIVDNLNAQQGARVSLELNNYKFALYRMYARRLGYKGKRHLLPICVQGYVDKHFVDAGEERTGFKKSKRHKCNDRYRVLIQDSPSARPLCLLHLGLPIHLRVEYRCDSSTSLLQNQFTVHSRRTPVPSLFLHTSL